MTILAEVLIEGFGRKPSKLPISFDQRAGDFPLDFESLQAKAVAPVEDACWDLLEIAAAVFAADTSTRRGDATRPDLGAGWRRSFTFSIPVIRQDIWSMPEMNEALIDAVSFLTGDEVRFSFTKKPGASGRQYPLLDDNTATPFPASEVILFSGGLDSLAGAMDRLANSADRVVLVSREGRTKETPRQKMLGRHLSRQFSGRVLHARFKAARRWGRGSDRTQRSRSLLFAALGYVHARVFGAPKISFYENGIISHNLPISPQIIGTMATRTTHPAALSKLARILDVLADATGQSRIELANPFRWLTKTEVVERLDAAGGAQLISRAVSCTSLHGRSREVTHCGACSQCLDRRFAVFAAGLEEHDPASAYQTDVFVGGRDTDRSRTMALDWSSHSLEMVDLSLPAFASRHAQDLVRIAGGYPDLTAAEVAGAAHALHARHGRSSMMALQRAVEKHSAAVVARGLPATSLLRMVLADRLTLQDTMLRPTFRSDKDRTRQSPEEDAGSSPSRDSGSIFPLQVSFEVSAHGQIVDVHSLCTLRGPKADLVHVLKAPFDLDRADQLLLEDYRYSPAGRLHPKGKNAAKMCVTRIRGDLEEAYVAIAGESADRELLVENKPQHGYRLDPTINIVKPGGDRP